MNVLIVEDDMVLSLVHKTIAEMIGLNVLGSAVSGEEALEKVIKLQPDLILMDVMLSDELDGIDAVLEMRKQNINTPVIFITGNSDAYNKRRAKKTNFLAYLIKPITLDTLQKSVSKLTA